MATPTRTNPWKIGFIILGIAIALWIGYAVTVPRLMMSWPRSNEFGGMFGGIGALFSGLALAGVVVAVLMQREELELQREELVATREELRRSAEAQAASSEALTKQIEVMQMTARLNALNSLLVFAQGNQAQFFTDHHGRSFNATDFIAETIGELTTLVSALRQRSGQH